MAVEIGSLIVRGAFRSAGEEEGGGVAPERLERELRRLHRRVLEDVRDLIDEAERRRRER